MRWVFGDLDVVVGRSVVALVLAGVLLVANVGGAIAVEDDSVGLVDPNSGQWHVENPDGTVVSFYFGNPGDVPFLGDWDCDSVATPGLFRTSDAFAYLRNTNTQGIADVRFFFGNPSDIPLAGDFDGDGCDSLSIYRPSEQRFYIMNKLGENEGGLGAAEYSFLFGNPGDKPVVGDWDGDGIDEIGLHRETTGFFYYRNTLTTGNADGQFYFGDPGDRFAAGDWGVVDGAETPAVYRPSSRTFYFRHTLTQGNADAVSTWGDPTWMPVAGPAGTVSVASGSESVAQFVPKLEAAVQTGNGAWLYSKIHPQALQTLGQGQCKSYFDDYFFAEPDYSIVMRAQSLPSLWETDGYGSTIRVANTYTLLSDITSFGATTLDEWHASLVGTQLHWFPVTCTPPTPPICLDSVNSADYDIAVPAFEATAASFSSTDGSCSGSVRQTHWGVFVSDSPNVLQRCQTLRGVGPGTPGTYANNLRGIGYLDAPDDWWLCGPE